MPIAAAMLAMGVALIAAPRGVQTLGLDLVLAIANVLIVFGVFTMASYGVVRTVEGTDRRVSHEERQEDTQLQ